MSSQDLRTEPVKGIEIMAAFHAIGCSLRSVINRSNLNNKKQIFSQFNRLKSSSNSNVSQLNANQISQTPLSQPLPGIGLHFFYCITFVVIY